MPWKILLASLFARHPEAWDVIGGSPTPGADVALNPQPQPPRFAFLISLAQTVISRAELLGDLAAATQREGEQQGIIVVGGYIARFVEDIGGNDFKLKWPFPWPPPDWFAREVSGIDLVVMAVQFDRAASQSYHRELRQSLANASIKLAETGLAKMQH